MRALLVRLVERLLLNALATGDFAAADRRLDWLERLDGRTRRVVHNRALVRLAQARYGEAEDLLEEELAARGDVPAVLRALAECGYLSGDRDKAVARLAAALAEPDCPDRDLLAKRAAIAADGAAYEHAMAGKRHVADAAARVAWRDFDGAVAALRRAVEADPTDIVAHNNLGTLLLNIKRDAAAAVRVFETAVALVDQPVFRRNLAAANEQLAKDAVKAAKAAKH